MSNERLIKSYRTVLLKFASLERGEINSFSEEFALQRFKKKFQKPDRDAETQLADETWQNWIDHDKTLPTSARMFAIDQPVERIYWHRARKFLKENLRKVDLTDAALVSFSSGSSFTPNQGQGSIEARLVSNRNPWDSTIEAFDSFAIIAYNHWALKKAAKWRYRGEMRRRGLTRDQLLERNLALYRRAKKLVENGSLCVADIGFQIFKWNLMEVTQFVTSRRKPTLIEETHDEQLDRLILGSRFSTVPKDNDARRPINLEPFCNLMVQKVIGQHIRNEMNRIWKKDLDTVPTIQRRRIADSKISTIDLKSASDSFSRSLVEFILPEHLFHEMDAVRSPFIKGPDGAWHFVNKMSSMGNGFTFEMMSLILLAVGRQIDPSTTVFGDDIIVESKYARRTIACIELGGLIVNRDKTFVDGPFRESCGGNFHSEEGYIESFDFKWPETVHDCIVLYNKAKRLSFYYESFRLLENDLYRLIPSALRGAPHHDLLTPPKGEFKDWVPKGSLVLAGLPHSLSERTDFEVMLNDAVCNNHDIPALNLSGYFRTGRGGSQPRADRLTRRQWINIRRFSEALCLGSGSHLIVFEGRKPVPRLRSNKNHTLTRGQVGKYAMYLHAGRRTDDTIRGDIKWVTETYISIHNRVFRLNHVLRTSRSNRHVHLTPVKTREVSSKESSH